VGHTNWVTFCDISMDGRFLLSVSNDKTLRIWNFESGNTLCVIDDVKCGAFAKDFVVVFTASNSCLKLFKFIINNNSTI